MPRFFGKYPGGQSSLDGKGSPVQTAEEAYQEGYRVGLNWDPVKSPWTPGGPWRTAAKDYERYQAQTDPNKADWVAYCDATVENTRRWQEGYHNGRFAADPNYVIPKYR